jgi:hypothetical protein
MTKTALNMSLLLVGLTAYSPESEALQLDLTREEICQVVPTVVVATVGDLETLWAPGIEGGLETRVWLSEISSIKGAGFAAGELVLPGGTLGELTHWVEDVPTLQLGQSYMFFLTTDLEGETRLVGGARGAVMIRQQDNGPGELLDSALDSLGGCDVR